MDDSFIDHLESTLPKMMAMLFLPFQTKIVHYENLESLLMEYFSTTAINPVARYPMDGRCGLDQINLYAGRSTSVRLGNLWRFLDFNGVNTINVGVCYDMVVVVGRNVLSDLEVDIPISRYPWLRHYYNHIIHGGARFFMTFPEDGLVNTHSLRSTCSTCKQNKKRCVRGGLTCFACTSANVVCVYGVDEAQKRRRESHAALRKNVDILCVTFQYIINLFSRRYGDGLHPANVVSNLASTLHDTIPVFNLQLEESVMFYADSFQHVAIMGGEISITRETRMDELWGFESPDEFQNRRDKTAVIAPHLGMVDPLDAYSLLNAAFDSPGELFYRDMCLVTRDFKGKSARIMAIAGTFGASHVTILLGWKFPLCLD